MIYKKLSQIQRALKAPKNSYNNFGKYKYRSAEGIIEAFKPYEEEYQVCLILSDEVVCIGEKNYIKANATLIDLEDESQFTVSAFAREAETKKGMDDSQITGTASSYARKYALNGLLLLDDSKDADTDAYHKQNDTKPLITKAKSLCRDKKVNFEAWVTKNGKTEETLTVEELNQMINCLRSA